MRFKRFPYATGRYRRKQARLEGEAEEADAIHIAYRRTSIIPLILNFPLGSRGG
jgi:hypothetical protein